MSSTEDSGSSSDSSSEPLPSGGESGDGSSGGTSGGGGSSQGTGGTTTPGGSGTTTPDTGGGSESTLPPSAYGTPGASSSFGAPTVVAPTPPTGSTPEGTEGGGTGAASSFGSGGGTQREEATTFNVPGAYGQSSQTLTSGEGRLGHPRFEYSASFDVGYDDNPLQVPTENPPIPSFVVQKGIDPILTFVPFSYYQYPGPPGKQPVIPGVASPPAQPVLKTIYLPLRYPGQEEVIFSPDVISAQRQGSFVMRAGVEGNVQFSNRNTAFTVDARLGTDYYLDRPGRAYDPNGSLSLAYVRKLSPRMQFSALLNGSYSSQPNLSQINTATNGSADLLLVNSKLDLSYRWVKRFQTDTSLTLSIFDYLDALNAPNNRWSATVGNEFRYSWSAKTVFVLEGRYLQTSYFDRDTLNTHSTFALVGGDFLFTRHLRSTVRLGEEISTFELTGDSNSSPYVETNLTWQFARASLLSANVRYGFEDPPTQNSTLETLRFGMNLAQAVTPRLRATIGTFIVNQTSTTDLGTGEALAFTRNTLQISLGAQYIYSRRLNFNANYTYTQGTSDYKYSAYYRNQLFMGFSYTF